MNSLAGSVFVQ